MTGGHSVELNYDVISSICTHLCLPERPTQRDGHLTWHTVSYNACYLPKLSLVSKFWRRPVQDLMLKYLYLERPEKCWRFASHIRVKAKIDQSYVRSPIAIDTSAYNPWESYHHDSDGSEEDYGAYSQALISILETCPNIRFVSIRIPSRNLRSNLVSALDGLENLKVLHLTRSVHLETFLEEKCGGPMSIMGWVDKRWKGMSSFGMQQKSSSHTTASVQMRTSDSGTGIDLRLPTQPEEVHEMFFKLLQNVTIPLRSLDFVTVISGRSDLNPETVKRYLNRFGPRLENLKLPWLYNKPNAMDQIVTLTPNLRNLVIDEANLVWWKIQNQNQTQPGSSASNDMLANLPPTLTSLDLRMIGGVDSDQMVVALESFSNLSSLKSLEVSGRGWSEEGREAVAVGRLCIPYRDDVFVLPDQ